MITSRMFYRSRQFARAIRSRASQEDLELVASILSPAELELFKQMQMSEQAHSLRVLNALLSQGETNIDLKTAALLHDVGKIRAPLHLWERVLIVLVKAICPGCMQKWGSAASWTSTEGLGWRRPFVVAEQHPSWGAELTAESGVSPLAVRVISRHQESFTPSPDTELSLEDILLQKLQSVDNNN